MERSPMLMDWLDQHCKNGYLTKSNLHIQFNPHQNSNSILKELEMAMCRFIWNNKKPRIAKTILNNKRTSSRITMPDIKLYDRAIVIKTAWYWYSKRQVDQWSTIEDPEKKPTHLWSLDLRQGN